MWSTCVRVIIHLIYSTKKRFAWVFEIDGKSYTFELINSTLSGKRTVMLNMEQIYH